MQPQSYCVPHLWMAVGGGRRRRRLEKEKGVACSFSFTSSHFFFLPAYEWKVREGVRVERSLCLCFFLGQECESVRAEFLAMWCLLSWEGGVSDRRRPVCELGGELHEWPLLGSTSFPLSCMSIFVSNLGTHVDLCCFPYCGHRVGGCHVCLCGEEEVSSLTTASPFVFVLWR